MKQLTATKKLISLLLILLLAVSFLCTLFACQEKEISYEYEIRSSVNAGEPGFSTLRDYRFCDCLYFATDDVRFFLDSTDTSIADSFVNSQLKLLRYLEKNGVSTKGTGIGETSYYLSDYEQNVTDSGFKKAYFDFTSVKTYKQILTTLQVIYGDYTNYGYLYALSNAIAKDLRWETYETPSVKAAELNTFFANEPLYLDLTYPCFTTEYVSQETVDNCKMLSRNLLAKLRWKNALSKPIDQQLSAFYENVDEYAKSIEAEYTAPSMGYAYFGATCPLKINTKYFEMFMAEGHYIDFSDDEFPVDDFIGYSNLANTVTTLYDEIVYQLERFSLLDTAEQISINFHTVDSCRSMYKKDYTNWCDPAVGIMEVTFLHAFLHEYSHYIEYLLNPISTYRQLWQSQAFAELCGTHSYYQHRFYYTAAHTEIGSEFWQSFFDFDYVLGREHLYLYEDISCYAFNDYSLAYAYGRDRTNSFSNYLAQIYGEIVICNLMLFPETVNEITGKTWETLQAEWEQSIKEKFKDVVLPDWINSP